MQWTKILARFHSILFSIAIRIALIPTVNAYFIGVHIFDDDYVRGA